jgi:glycosidase
MGADSEELWYKDAVFYELYVRAFCDSNGDGKGDFQGLIQKLDYVQDLGIDCIWLLPIYASMGTTLPTSTHSIPTMARSRSLRRYWRRPIAAGCASSPIW